MVNDFVILGAGISGALVAAALNSLSKSVQVIDKGRSVGGRLSCKRFNTTYFNHGLQKFDCKIQNRPWIDELIKESFIDGMHPHKILAPANQIIKKVLSGVRVTSATEIKSVDFKNSIYVISSLDQTWQARNIICTFPAEQTLKLLNVWLKHQDIVKLRNVIYSKKLICFLDSSVDFESCTDFSIERSENSQMIIFSEAITDVWFELSDSKIFEAIKEKFKSSLGLVCSSLMTIKKWRYAQCLKPISQRHIRSQNDSLMLIGDAFGLPTESPLERAISSAESTFKLLVHH